MESTGQAGAKGTEERNYSFLFRNSRFGGTEDLPFGGNGSNNPGRNGNRKNSDRRNSEHPGNKGKRGGAAGTPDG